MPAAANRVTFVSYSFLFLFAVTLAARVSLGRDSRRPRYLAVLLGASLVFYAWHTPVYIWILLASTVVDYGAGRYLGVVPRRAASWRRRVVLGGSLLTNLGLLAYFKYADFARRSVEKALATLGVDASWPTLEVVLPMGISFYTFQSMSYTIDVYRGRLDPLRSFWRFLLYVSFFPQLVAGPIVRATEFLPQLDRRRLPRLSAVNQGLFLVVSGLFLKVVCADNLGRYVDAHWAEGYTPGASSARLVWLTLMFSAQIFGDFAGYTNIARGLALMLGFRLPINFDSPYLASSFKNFWERWHITLSRWLRDYLYVSLGGNRVSPGRTYVNLLLVMVLGGLWHGAALTFVVWGALHGTALAVERRLGLHRRGEDGPAPGAAWLWCVVVQTVVLVTWVFFRSESVEGAVQFLTNVAAGHPGAWSDGPPWPVVLLLLPIVLMHAWRWLEERGVVASPGPAARAVLTGVMGFLVLTGYGATNDFIYFQF